MRLRQVGFRRVSFQEPSDNLPLRPPATLTVCPPVSSSPSILNCLAKWALIELARNLDVQDTLRAELQSGLGATDDPGYSQRLNALSYLDAFTSEVLRTHPGVAELTREVCVLVIWHVVKVFFIHFRRPMWTTPSHSPNPSAPHLGSSSTASSSLKALPSVSPSLVSTCPRNCGEVTLASLTRIDGC